MNISNMNHPLYNALSESIAEANRFIEKAKLAQLVLIENKYAWSGTKETGAAKRASMDLTRSLVTVRKPSNNDF